MTAALGAQRLTAAGTAPSEAPARTATVTNASMTTHTTMQ